VSAGNLGLSDNQRHLFAQLRQACREDWRAYCEHDFVNRLGDGSLGIECFRHYLLQDYLFLIQFARAHALLVYKSETLAEMARASSVLSTLLDGEMRLHVEFCESWGLTRADMEAVEEHPANMAYTRYVLERGMAGDALDLLVALLPCTVGYAEIGARLREQYSDSLATNPYRTWVEAYSANSYQESAEQAVAALDQLASRASEERFASLCKTFRQATRLEIGFWAMGLNPPA